MALISAGLKAHPRLRWQRYRCAITLLAGLLTGCSAVLPGPGSESDTEPDTTPAATSSALLDSTEPLAASCGGCHSPSSSITHLTTLSQATLLQQMRQFKSDHIDNTVMGRIAKGYSDDELQRLARALGQP